MSAPTTSKRSLAPFGTAMAASTISTIGTQMTVFALIAWAWEITGSATAAGAVTMATFISAVVASAFAGALVDRWNRKWAVIWADVVGLLGTGAVLWLYSADRLEIWHLAVLGALIGIIDAIASPAYLSSVSLMVPKEHATRANAMFQLSYTLSLTIAPGIGGLLYSTVGVPGILLIDVVSFAVVMVTVYLLNIPQPEDHGKAERTFWQDIVDGFKYVWQRPSLLWLLLIATGVNIGFGTWQGLFRPMVLALTGGQVDFLGRILSVYGIGAVCGGMFMLIWKGPSKRMPLHLFGWLMAASCGFVLAPLVRIPNLWFITGFGQGFFGQVAVALGYAIWQAKVPPAMQGRVFSIMGFVARVSIPAAVSLSVLISDQVVEPAMSAGTGSLARIFGPLVGTGTGTGMSLVLFLAGCLAIILPVVSFFLPTARNVEAILPDQQSA